MTVMRDEDVRFRNLSRKIGLFVLVAVTGIAVMFVSLAVKKGVFRKTTELHFIADTGQDIREGMAVKLSGFRIGKVESLVLAEDAKVRVQLRIDSEYMKWIRRDSSARLAKEGLIGDAIIDIPPGSDASAPLRSGDRIAFSREAGITSVVDKLYGQVEPLIQDIRRLTRYLDDPNGDVKQALHRLNTAMAELNATIKRVDRIMAAAEKDLPGTLRATRETIDKSRQVVDSVSRTWPISNNIEPPKPGTLPVDSYLGPPKAPAAAGKP